jgi:hypothetical protein
MLLSTSIDDFHHVDTRDDAINLVLQEVDPEDESDDSSERRQVSC